MTDPRRRRDGRGRTSDGPVPLSEALSEVSRRMGMASPDLLHVIFGRWEDIVGASVASHVRPQRLRGDSLVVSADHPAWATQVRQLAPQILARLADACSDPGMPQRLEVRVRRV